jgi:hypothetical protein
MKPQNEPGLRVAVPAPLPFSRRALFPILSILFILSGVAWVGQAEAAPPTLAQLPASKTRGIDLRVRKSSAEIPASPFATLTSFEVHGESEDAGVIKTMSELGVKWVVMHNIHGSLPDPADRRLNAWLDGCSKAGIRVRCILASRDLELWRKAVRNYGDRIKSFCYLNEPNAPTNNDHTKPAVPPEVYAGEFAELKRTIRAIRPDVRLFGPESAMLQCMEEQPYPWLRLALAAGLARSVDGLSIHPYRQGYSPENIPENPSTFGGRPTARYRTYEEQIAVLRKMAGGLPISVHEVGWSTAPTGPLNTFTSERITELTQAKFALRQQIMDFALGMDVAVYFLLRERHDNAPLPHGHMENHFGIVHVDNSPKPAYTALQTLYSQLDASTRLNRAVPVSFSTPGVKWYVFDSLRSAPSVRRVVYWLPVPARDDFPVQRTDVTVAGAIVPGLPLSEAPRILRLHHIDGVWGYPALVDLMSQTIDTDMAWRREGRH